MADFFISYTSSDREWAFWFHKELTALGHVPHVHEWEIGAGDDIYAWMEARHDAADHVLCVVSDDYLKAPYSTLERNAALWQAASARPGFVLFVVVKPCHLPTLVDHIRRCELFGMAEDEARVRFRDFLAAPEEAKAKVFPGQTFAVSNIPIHVPLHFMGRDESLAAIAVALQRYEGRVAITALHGMRGVGKTTLAAAYAERHRADYRATWWIRAQTEATMRADLVALGVRLRWVEADAKEEPALTVVMERLRHEGQGILLIYDNAIDAAGLKPYLPRGGGVRVLVTSNAPTWRGLAEPVEIRLWPAHVGADYLIARTGRAAERAAAEVLSDTLGGLPLAHEQAAAYCERLKVGFADYGRRFAATPAKFLDDARHAPIEHNDGLTVAKSFALGIEEATKLHPAAELLIVHAALLAPEPIPLYLFAEGRAAFGEPLTTWLAADGLDEALAALEVFALIDRETIPDERDPAITTDTIRLHRLVRQVAAARCVDEAREAALGRLVQALVAVFPDRIWQNPETWPRVRRLDALALAFAAPTADLPYGFEASVATLLDFVGVYRLSALDAYGGGRALLERALAIKERMLGPEHRETAKSLNNLASLLQAQGDLVGARPLFERSLAIREKVLGPEHTGTATSLGNLAMLLQAQGDLVGARPLFERSLAIHEKVLGPEHTDTATSLGNLAILLRAQGDLVGARPVLERALAIHEKVLGPEHRETAKNFNNFASLLHAQGDLVGAYPLLERALAINEKVLGPEHTGTATSLGNLAMLLQAQGDLVGARPLLERALAIHEKVLGPEHTGTARNLNNLASLLQAQGDLVGARPVLERALAIHEKVLGPEHTETATSYSNLARLLRETGAVARAEMLFLKAIAIGEKALGASHSTTQRYRSHYARLLLDTARAAEARVDGEAALAIHEAQGGANHPWTKDSARVTADALEALGEEEKAALLRARYGLEG